MRRREFIALAGSAAAGLPLAARAQHGAMPVAGFLGSATAEGYAKVVALIRAGLSDVGFVEGKNIAFEFRWADGHFDRLPALAADLVSRRVGVIITTGGPLPAKAAKEATSTIPIVFATGSDPVQGGLVPKLSGSGANVTGVTFLNAALIGKRLEIIAEAVPKARVFAMLVNSESPRLQADREEFTQAAARSGAQVLIVHAAGQGDPETAFAEIVRKQVDALLVHFDAVLYGRIREIIALAASHRMPAIYFIRECAELGGLMSYGADNDQMLHQAGVYAGRILRGEKPADLPVQQPTRFELVVNLKTARALGIALPPGLLARADQIIE